MFGRKGRRDGTHEMWTARTEPAADQAAPSSLLATCPGCGDVVVDVTLARVVRDEETCWYSFACPSCSRDVDVEAPRHLVTVLLCLGATEAEIVVPEPEPALVAPETPLTADEVLDLTARLHETDDLMALLQA